MIKPLRAAWLGKVRIVFGKGRHHLANLNIDGRIILRWIVGERVLRRIWTGL
jgi:hypothetical protein